MSGYVLGFNCYMQDAAACLLHNGQVVAAVEEERLTRQKHTGGFPIQAIQWCLKKAGISVNDLAHVAFNMQPWIGMATRTRQLLADLPRSVATFGSRGANWWGMVTVKRHFQKHMGPGTYQWHWVPHHETHAASAFWPSGFESAAVLVVDGSGELASSSWYNASANQLELLGQLNFPHSYGYFFSALTQWLGFTPAIHEGKTMGLAAHGQVDPVLLSHFEDMISDQGHINTRWFRFQHGGDDYFSPLWEKHLGPARVPESEFSDRHIAVAAAGQARLEEVLLTRLRKLHKETGQTALCLAGGVALNCSANGRILSDTPFEQLFVQPAAHDSGTAYGAALMVHKNVDGTPIKAQRSVAWGPSFEAADITQTLAARKLAPRTVDNAIEATAQLLADGKVVGWFDGALEFGPRALGQRSILADPRQPEMADHVNARVKHRESFRPFAPAVLVDQVGDYFEGTATPFMTTILTVRPECRNRVPAITHANGTARVQTVSSDNGAYFDLIKAFNRITGVPMLLNTSFNLRGEAIVCTPEQAIDDYLKTDMDALYLQGQLLVKSSD